jgi:hypothetical protein
MCVMFQLNKVTFGLSQLLQSLSHSLLPMVSSIVDLIHILLSCSESNQPLVVAHNAILQTLVGSNIFNNMTFLKAIYCYNHSD